MEYELVKITILKDNKKIDEIEGKIIKKEKKHYIIAMGRIGKYNYNIHDNKKKIHWGNVFEIPTYDLNILKNDIMLKLDIDKKNINYKMIRRNNDLNLNDMVNVKLLYNEHISFNDNMEHVLKIPNITDGIICKITNINLWEPPPDIEKNKKILKIIPGSFTVACGKYSKTFVDKIDTSPLYNSNDICNQLQHEINKLDCVFTIHFRDIGLKYEIIKI